MWNLLSLITEILDLCKFTLEEDKSANTEVVKIIKNEFEKQYESIKNEKKVIVLNKNRDIWATRTINDSADFNFDSNLFKLVYNFADLVKKVPTDDLITLYK